jgi:hypothetical protein
VMLKLVALAPAAKAAARRRMSAVEEAAIVQALVGATCTCLLQCRAYTFLFIDIDIHGSTTFLRAESTSHSASRCGWYNLHRRDSDVVGGIC